MDEVSLRLGYTVVSSGQIDELVGFLTGCS